MPSPRGASQLPRPGSATRAGSTLSLDRTTEQEGIVVDEGYCEVEDGSYTDAADRLALLDHEELSEPSRPSSYRSLGGFSEPHASPKRSDGSPSKPPGAESAQPKQRTSVLKPRGSAAAAAAPTGVKSADSGLSARSSNSLPPGSPFSLAEVQTSTFAGTPAEEVEAKLKTTHLNDRLLSGLQSLTMDELTVYMQLTEELKREGVGQPPAGSSATQKETGSPVAPGSAPGSDASSDSRLDGAVRRLQVLLPPAAIEQLRSHASYGLMDVIHSQALTPPPTPTGSRRPNGQ